MSNGTPAAGNSNDPLEKLPLPLERQVESASADFVRALHAGNQPRIEDYVTRIPEEARPRLLLELIADEASQIRSVDQDVNRHDYESRFPDQKDVVELAISMATPGIESTLAGPPAARARRPKPNAQNSQEETPDRIGRYKVGRLLGKGSFGCV